MLPKVYNSSIRNIVGIEHQRRAADGGAVLLIDAGTGVGDLTLDELSRIEHILVSHSHLDHVLSIGLLGLAALQVSGLRVGQSSFYRAQAAQFATDMADRLRANLGEARTCELALADATPTSPTTTCQRDLAEWRTRLATGSYGDVLRSNSLKPVSLPIVRPQATDVSAASAASARR